MAMVTPSAESHISSDRVLTFLLLAGKRKGSFAKVSFGREITSAGVVERIERLCKTIALRTSIYYFISV